MGEQACALAQAVDYTFTTGDGAELTNFAVDNYTPYNDQSNVPTNTRIAIQYNQRVNPLSLDALRLREWNTGREVAVEVSLERPDTVVLLHLTLFISVGFSS